MKKNNKTFFGRVYEQQLHEHGRLLPSGELT